MGKIRCKPKGIPCTDVTLFMMFHCCCSERLGIITRDIWVPDVVLASEHFQLKLPDIDNERLSRHNVDMTVRCLTLAWDYEVNRVRVDLMPLVLNSKVADETVALLTSILREADWKNTRTVYANWKKHHDAAGECDEEEVEEVEEDEYEDEEDEED